MKTYRLVVRVTVVLIALTLAARLSSLAIAHCDSMDGPVVKEAQRALAEKKVDPVLKWVRADDEPAIREAFDLALAVRGESERARKLTDQYFFETLVRLHRAGEGEAFNGLKAAGSAASAIVATDGALAEGNIDQLADRYAAAVRDAVKHRFDDAHTKRKVAEESSAQGREYVQAYVELTHFVENLDYIVSNGANHQHRETQAVPH
jgi:hypothetical protein